MKFHLDNNIVEVTPEELVKYQELLKEKEKEKEKVLFPFGHEHQPSEQEVQDTFKGIFGSLKKDSSYIGSTESSTDEADLGEFYIVNVDNSALLKGTMLKKTGKHTHKDSLGEEYLYVDVNALEHIDKHLYQLEDRFSFATQIGIRLSDITDLARATEGDYFKVTESNLDLSVGDIVTITKDDRDNQPQCKDKHGNFCYVSLCNLELIQDNLESTESSTDEEETSSTELQVGDRVKVLKSKLGAEGEATVTALLGHGDVALAGTNKRGRYLTNWSNHVSNLEKIEEEDKYMGYTFWYIDDSIFNNRVVLKTTLWDYFEDSKGRRYTYKEVHGLTSPINKKIAREEFEEAKNNDGLLRYYSSLDVFAWE